MFKRWAQMIGEDSWIDDPRFASDEKRVEHSELISARVNAWTATRTSEEALAALDKAAIPSVPLLPPEQALEHPHIRTAGLLGEMDSPGTNKAASHAFVVCVSPWLMCLVGWLQA